MRTIITFLALAAFVNNASALNCLLCLGSTNSDCSRGDVSAMVIQRCEDSLPAMQNSTLSQLMAPSSIGEQRDDPPIRTTCVSFIAANAGVTFFERGCGFIWEGVDICQYMTQYIDVKACSDCDTDLCNNNPLDY